MECNKNTLQSDPSFTEDVDVSLQKRFLTERLPLFRLNPCGMSQPLFPWKEKSITCGQGLICVSAWEFQRDAALELLPPSTALPIPAGLEFQG